jgi:Ca-activated chloride channel family protein
VAKTLGIKIYTIGVGVRGQAPFPVQDAFGRQTIVMQKVDVDEETLKKVAETTGGQFYRATDTDSLRNIYGQIDKLEKTVHTIKKFETYEEKMAWFLIPCLGLMVAEVLLAQTRFRRLP